MPAMFNDQLDDQVQFDQILDFSGGVDMRQSPPLLSPNQFSLAVNLDRATNATAASRPGTSVLGTASTTYASQGLIYMDSSTVEQLLSIHNGVVYKYNNTSWASVTGYTPSASVWVDSCQLLDKVFFTDGSTNMFSYNGSTFTDLGNTNLQPPRAKYTVSHAGRVFGAGVTGHLDTVYMSDSLDGTTWDQALQNVRIPAKEGSSITGLCSWDNFYLVVGMENSMHLINCDPLTDPTQYTVQIIHNSVGCVAHRTMAQVGSDVWFLSREGVKSVNRLIQETQLEVTTSISEQVRPIIDRINWDHVSACHAKFWNNKYILAVPIDSSTVPNYMLVYDTFFKSWMGYWIGHTPTGFAKMTFNQDARLVWGDSTGKHYKFMDRKTDAIYDDNGVDIPTQLKTGGFTLKDYVSEKSPLALQVDFVNSSADVNIDMDVDEQGNTRLASNVPSADTSLTFPMTFPIMFPRVGIYSRVFPTQHIGRFRSVQVNLTTTGGYVAYRGLILSGFIEAMALER